MKLGYNVCNLVVHHFVSGIDIGFVAASKDAFEITQYDLRLAM